MMQRDDEGGKTARRVRRIAGSRDRSKPTGFLSLDKKLDVLRIRRELIDVEKP